MDQMKTGGGAEEVEASSGNVAKSTASNDYESSSTTLSAEVATVSALNDYENISPVVSETLTALIEHVAEDASASKENVSGSTEENSSEKHSIIRENSSGNPLIIVENAQSSVANMATPEVNNSGNATTLIENTSENTTVHEVISLIDNAAATTENDSASHRSTMTDTFSDSISPNCPNPFISMGSKNKSISTLKTCLGKEDDQFETDSDLDNSWSSAEFVSELRDFCRMRVSRTLHNGEGEFTATDGEENFHSDTCHLRQKAPFPVPDVHVFKIVFVGDPNVGKTSIVQRYSRRVFMESYVPTIGVDFNMRLVKLDDIGFVRLLIFDLAGEERVSQISKVYYRRTQGAVCVYDESNMQGFDNILCWAQNVRDAVSLPHGCELPIVLLGNKCDLLSEEEKEARDKSEFARENGFLGAYHTSAKLDIGINEAMSCLITQMIEIEKKKEGLPDQDGFSLRAEENSRTNCFGNSNSCCS